MTTIKARFAPLCADSSSTDLQRTLKQLLETEVLLKESYQKRRASLSAKIVKSRNRLRNKIKQQATKRLEQAIDLKLRELSELSNYITKSCYENSLQTIKAVCIAVFNEYPEAYSLIMQKSLDRAFSQINSAKILLLKVPEFKE